jgi:glycogen synthase
MRRSGRPEHGMGLDSLPTGTEPKLGRILNGVDYSSGVPRSDRHIRFHYSPASLWRKEKNKAELLRIDGTLVRAARSG